MIEVLHFKLKDIIIELTYSQAEELYKDLQDLFSKTSSNLGGYNIRRLSENSKDYSKSAWSVTKDPNSFMVPTKPECKLSEPPSAPIVTKNY